MMSRLNLVSDIKDTLTHVHAIIEIIPIPVLHLCAEIKTKLPNFVKPLAGSVLVQLIICGMYNIILKLHNALGHEKDRLISEKRDYVIAFGEQLLNLKSDREDLLQIQIIADRIMKTDSEKNEQNPLERDMNTIGDEYSYIMSDLVATDLLMDECGRYALKVLHRYKLQTYYVKTVWKFHDFSINQILREVNFGDLKVQYLPYFFTFRGAEL